jgi:branched-subunit amino acid ABC-type transport system permease component
MTNWLQVLFNSAVTGSLYLISAVALTLTYGLSRFPNFAHAEFMTLGAYMGYLASEQFHLPFALALVFSFVGAGLLGLLSYWGIFGRLAKRGSSLIHLMVASMAVGIIARYLIISVWSSAYKSFNIVWPGFDLGPVHINAVWLLPIFAALVAGVGMHLALTHTKIGKAIRATSSNPELAMSSGINTTRVLLVTWFLSAGLAGLAGLFRGLSTGLLPLMGWDILLPTVAVAVLGGIGSFYGAIVAAFIIGLAENVAVVLLTQMGLSNTYRMAVPFLVLIVVLLYKPEGLTKLFKGN